MTLRMIRQASVSAGPAVLILGLAAAAFGQEPTDKPYQIRARTEAFVKAHALTPNPKDGAQKVRLIAALNEMTHRTREFLRDSAQTDRLLDSGMRVLEAELDYYGRSEQVMHPAQVDHLEKLLKKHLEISRELATIIEERVKGDLASEAQQEYARYCRSSVEVAIQKLRYGGARA